MLRRLARPDLRRPPPLAVDRWGLLPALSTGFDKLPVGERRRTCSVWGNEWVFGNVVKCAELLIQLLGTSDGGPWCRRWTASRCGWCFTRWRTAARLPPRRPARRRAWPAPAAGGSPGPPGRRPGGPDPRPAAHTPGAGTPWDAGHRPAAPARQRRSCPAGSRPRLSLPLPPGQGAALTSRTAPSPA